MRSVGAKLKLDVQDYVHGADRAKLATKGVEDKLNDAAKAGDKTAKAAADIGRVAPRALKLTERAASELDRQIDETRKSYEKLRDQFERTGDLTVFKAMGKELAKLDKQLKNRRSIFGDGDDSKKQGLRIGANMAEGIAAGLSRAGGPVSAALANVFGTLPPHAQMAIGGSLVAAVGLAAPAIGAAVSGAALAGIGSGALAIGVAAAFQDQRVKAAAQGLGAQAKSVFSGVGDDFAGDTVAAIRRIRSELSRLGLREALAPAAGFIRPLTEGLTGLTRNAMPGLRAAIAAAQQPIDAISRALPRLGTAVGSLLEMFARHAEAGAAALKMLFDVVIVGVKVIEMQIEALATMFEFFDSLPSWMTGVAGTWVDSAKQAGEATGEWDTRLDGLAGALTGAATAADGLNGELVDMRVVMDQVANANMSLDEAMIRYRQSLDAAKDAADGHKRVTDDERLALIGLSRAAQDTEEKLKAAGVSTKDLAKHQRNAREDFIRAATAMGYTRTEAGRLADKYGLIPEKVNTDANFNKQDAERKAEAYRRKLRETPSTVRTSVSLNKQYAERQLSEFNSAANRAARARTVWFHVRQSGSLGAIGQRASGGPVRGPGTATSDSVPMMLSTGEYVIRASAARAVGEPFLDRLNRADSYQPATMEPTWQAAGSIGDWSRYRPMTGGGAQRVEVVARVVGPPGVAGDFAAVLTKFIQLEVWDKGSGDVQRAFGKRP